MKARKCEAFWRRACVLLLIIIFSPLLLLALYQLPFVHPVSTLMLRDVISLRGYQRQWVPIENISPALIHAVLVAEDGRFCEHQGIDWQALQQVVSNEAGPQRGASTITMQVTKNLFLWHDRSYLRKGVEIPLSIGADALLSKKRIMEIYLNIAEWGPGIYGAEAAARHYFGNSAKDISARQGALLAIALPNPETRNPAHPTRKLNAIARVIEARAYRSGAYITCLQ